MEKKYRRFVESVEINHFSSKNLSVNKHKTYRGIVLVLSLVLTSLMHESRQAL
jgi:hypothetical protein